MTPVIPCEANPELKRRIDEFAEVLKTQSHMLGAHGLDEQEFYQSGILRGAVERMRGQYSATMREKREFVRLVLNHLQDTGFIDEYSESDGPVRHDYAVTMQGGRVCAIALKGCLDGNNTNIFERPAFAQEFVLWSICTNPGADPRHNVWSGIHTRLSAEIAERQQQVDGLVVWDWLCGTVGRPCPKLVRGATDAPRLTEIGPYRLTPPCIYLFPDAPPSAPDNPAPPPHQLQAVSFLDALHRCFGGLDDEVNSVQIVMASQGLEVARRTTISRSGEVVHQSAATAIRRR